MALLLALLIRLSFPSSSRKVPYRVTWLYRPWPVEEGYGLGSTAVDSSRLCGLSRVWGRRDKESL